MLSKQQHKSGIDDSQPLQAFFGIRKVQRDGIVDWSYALSNNPRRVYVIRNRNRKSFFRMNLLSLIPPPGKQLHPLNCKFLQQSMDNLGPSK